MLTSYYSKTPPTVPGAICISRSQPRWHNGKYPSYKALAPGKWYKMTDIDQYTALYYEEILGPLDPQQVRDDLYRIAQEQARSLGLPEEEVQKVRPILLCFESTGFCHRRLAANWLESALDIEVPEGYMDKKTGQLVFVPGWEQQNDPGFEQASSHAPQQMAEAQQQLNLLSL
jgi:hypothetical protein